MLTDEWNENELTGHIWSFSISDGNHKIELLSFYTRCTKVEKPFIYGITCLMLHFVMQSLKLSAPQKASQLDIVID